MDDIFELIIYIIIGVVGLLVTAYRSKQKRQAQSPGIPRGMTEKAEPNVEPDFGPLAEILGIPDLARPKPVEVSETKEENIEEAVSYVESDELSVDQVSHETDQQPETIESDGFEAEKVGYEGIPVFESTDKDAIYDAITDVTITDMSETYIPISDSEVSSSEIEDEVIDYENIDWRKAVIYSEILKRRGN